MENGLFRLYGRCATLGLPKRPTITDAPGPNRATTMRMRRPILGSVGSCCALPSAENYTAAAIYESLRGLSAGLLPRPERTLLFLRSGNYADDPDRDCAALSAEPRKRHCCPAASAAANRC